ncbi:MAG: aminomethyl-transferring glycine dehydrogenase subunit GcvPB [Spirochaetales bacterium]|nr:aminomethyl-transferring glycine dehydrogenase subunit GcvPB [Spirochaetales bacterium]
MKDTLIFEESREGRRGFTLPAAGISGGAKEDFLPKAYRRSTPAALPELSEVEVVRHFTGLSMKNYGIDLGFYPLGSCTMKYNPKVNEDVVLLPGFAELHPLQTAETAQGTLELLHGLITDLCGITGMRWGTLQPFAGAHGEFTAMKLFRAYFDHRKDDHRKKILIPDSAHGTNPASAHLAGFQVVELPSDPEGYVDLEALEEHLDDTLAGIMLTNPNTLGRFEKDIRLIARKIHQAGGLLYYDGANMNAILGHARPGDMGFDAVHLNIHKTFSTPHGGGGPGSGPVLVGESLEPYLPVPDIRRDGDTFRWASEHRPRSIGRVSGFYGNIAVLLRAVCYLRMMGSEGLKAAGTLAVLNANYLKRHLTSLFDSPDKSLCKHEFVLSAKTWKEKHGITALDIAKALLDRGIHPPTIYFPLTVPEALMIEPTETESRETLDSFVDTLKDILTTAKKDPEALHRAPEKMPVSRIDEVRAAKTPILRWRKER